MDLNIQNVVSKYFMTQERGNPLEWLLSQPVNLKRCLFAFCLWSSSTYLLFSYLLTVFQSNKEKNQIFIVKVYFYICKILWVDFIKQKICPGQSKFGLLWFSIFWGDYWVLSWMPCRLTQRTCRLVDSFLCLRQLAASSPTRGMGCFYLAIITGP